MTKNIFSLEGKSIVVTGAGRGLGRAIAMGLAELGANVIVAGRTKEPVDSVTAEITECGGSAIAFSFDANNDTDVEQMVNAATAWKGSLHGMVVNHGVALHSRAEDTPTEGFRSVIETNVTSCFVCARTAGRQMLEQGTGGSIVLISSTSSTVAHYGLTAYGTSKGGVDHLSHQLAAEWADRKVRVNAVAPGYMNSFMKGTEEKYGDVELKKKITSKIPMARWGEPQELVGAAAYLLSDASTYTTGQYIAVDGGNSII